MSLNKMTGFVSNLGIIDKINEIVTETNTKITLAQVPKEPLASSSTNGLMAKEDKIKLDGVAVGANNYTHPSAHPPSIITQDSNNRFVTDIEKTTWTNKAEKSVVTNTANGLMINTDKVKLDGIEANSNNYTHPATHSPAIIVQDANNRFITDAERTAWNAKETPTGAQAKATAVQTNLNTHASNSTIHVTSADKTNWSNKYTKEEIDNKFSAVELGSDWKETVATFASIATTYTTPENGWTVNVKDSGITYRYNGVEWIPISANAIPMVSPTVSGLMSKEDKAKLNGIEEYSNNYTHPLNHSPSIITQDANNRFVSDTQVSLWTNKAEKTVSTPSSNGLMSSSDKLKLDGIAANSNNYTHPATHLPGIIVQDASNRFVTDTEKDTWNGKANNTVVTTTADGLMIKTDKTKLDGIAVGANNYVHPANHPPSIILQDASNRFVTDTEKATWSGKANNTVVTTSLDGLMLKADKIKLDGIAVGANNYTHPANHPASFIIQDVNNRFITDVERTNWNAKETPSGAQAKADVVQTNLNNHTGNSVIHVTSLEKTNWGNKYTKEEIDNIVNAIKSGADWKPTVATYNDILTTYPNPESGWTVNVQDTNITYTFNGAKWIPIGIIQIPVVSETVDGLMGSNDKVKLNSIEVGANKYIHPVNHPASIIAQDANNRFVSDAEKTTWNSKANNTVATSSANGIMSKEDKVKLDGIETGSNKYIHPATHPATMITQDASNRFVTDTEKDTWNGKANNTVATTTANGLLSLSDKAKLDSIQTNANAYSHPATHPATMIVQDASNRFVSDSEKSTWNGKANNVVATTSANGLMSYGDKTKLDNLKIPVMNKTLDLFFNSSSNLITTATPTSIYEFQGDNTSELEFAFSGADLNTYYINSLDKFNVMLKIRVQNTISLKFTVNIRIASSSEIIAQVSKYITLYGDRFNNVSFELPNNYLANPIALSQLKLTTLIENITSDMNITLFAPSGLKYYINSNPNVTGSVVTINKGIQLTNTISEYQYNDPLNPGTTTIKTQYEINTETSKKLKELEEAAFLYSLIF